MWNRCTCVAPKALWSGSIPRGPSSSTSDPTPSPQQPHASLSVSNPPQIPVAPTSTWTEMESCGYCCMKRTRLRARCTASAFRRGRSSSRLSRTWTSAAGSQRSSTSWSATGWDQRRIHWVVRYSSVLMCLQYHAVVNMLMIVLYLIKVAMRKVYRLAFD